MRITLRLACTALALMSFAADAPGQERPIIGNYSVSGITGTGSKYLGTAVVAKIGGEMYRVAWTLGSRVFSGTCFRENQWLSCSSCPAPLTANVTSYLTGPTGLDGVFIDGGSTTIGRERLTPRGQKGATKDGPASNGQMDPVTFAGKFDVKGTNPDQSKYTGTASVRRLEVSPSAYYFDWTLGALVMHGVGVRDATGSPLVAAQCGGRNESVALVYGIDIKGRILTGTWTQEISGALTAGTEVMMKLK